MRWLVVALGAMALVVGMASTASAADYRDKVIKTSDGYSWYVDNSSVRHWIPNGGTYLCLTAWKGKQVVNVTWAQAGALPETTHASCTVTEARDKVLKESDGTSWYVDNSSVKHWIPNGGTYLCLTAWKGKSVLSVTQNQVDALPTGSNKSCTVTEARDKVIRKSNGDSWYVDNSSVKHHIPNGGTYLCLTAWKGKSVINNVTQNQVDALPTGSSKSCTVTEARDKVIRKSDGSSWYVDDSSVKHRIPNGGTYLCLTAWKGKAVINNVTQDQVDALPTGNDKTCTVTEARDKVIRLSSGDSWYVDNSSVRHHIPNGGTYLCLTAWNNKQVLGVNQDQVDALPLGGDASCTVTQARDKVIRKSDGSSWYVDNSSVKHRIPDGGTYLCLTAWKGKAVINNVTQDQVDALPTGNEKTCTVTEARDKIIRLPNGDSWYVDISSVRHWIPDGGVYECLKAQGKAVLAVTQDQVDALPEGDQQECGGEEMPPGSCPYGDVTVLAARGSGEERNIGSGAIDAGKYGMAVQAALDERLPGVIVGLVGVDYPAVSVPKAAIAALLGLNGLNPIATAILSDYPESVQQGVIASAAQLGSILEQCGIDHPVVLVGYSQGAHVMQLLQEEIADDDGAQAIVATGLFANPMFTWEDSASRGTFPHSATGIASVFVGHFSTAEIRDRFAETTRTWCLRRDPVCDANLANIPTLSVHTGSGYGVDADGNPLGRGAVLDVVNTAVWALHKRGVPTPEEASTVIVGLPSVSETAFWQDGDRISSTLWFTAAPLYGEESPVMNYLWDLNDDGVFERSTIEPAVSQDYVRTATGEPGATEVVANIEVIVPGAYQTYELCWDVRTGSECGVNIFSDDDGSIFRADITWLADQEITTGCTVEHDEFCPAEPVTRGQMAAFLVRALALDGSTSGEFLDTGGSIFEADISKLAAVGITKGCNPPLNDRFCPDQVVTRGQMAAFLVRALGLTDTGTVDFVDDNNSVFEADIAKLAAAGVTKGCNPPANDRFCPNEPVTREQMAAFLHRALGG